jgi:hypothetical protein
MTANKQFDVKSWDLLCNSSSTNFFNSSLFPRVNPLRIRLGSPLDFFPMIINWPKALLFDRIKKEVMPDCCLDFFSTNFPNSSAFYSESPRARLPAKNKKHIRVRV